LSINKRPALAKAQEDLTASGLSLVSAIARLEPLYPASEPLSDPLALIVWDNIGYLIDDEHRAALFDEFKDRIGLEAARIANAPTAVLGDIARRGGMNPQTRAERLREIGALAIAQCDGNLAARLRALPLAKARALLKMFPAIGDPGADKILLFSGITVRPALDSNGLRAMVRMGFCVEEKSYGQTYKAAIAVLTRDGRPGARWLKRAYVVLREHGKTLCKRTAPICEPCPLDRACAHRQVAKL
jgi:endonuclease III